MPDRLSLIRSQSPLAEPCTTEGLGCGATALAQPVALSPERTRADLALTVALDKLSHLQEARARYTADTTDDAYRLMMAAQEAAQATVSAFMSFRERVTAA